MKQQDFLSSFLAFAKALQELRPGRVPETPYGLGIYLADPLASDAEDLADLFEGVVLLLSYAEPHPEHLLLAGGEAFEHEVRLVGEVLFNGRVRRGGRLLVLYEVPERALLVVADGRFKAQGLLHKAQYPPYLGDRYVHPLGYLFGVGLPAEFLQ